MTPLKGSQQNAACPNELIQQREEILQWWAAWMMDSLDNAESEKSHTPVEVSRIICSAAYQTADHIFFVLLSISLDISSRMRIWKWITRKQVLQDKSDPLEEDSMIGRDAANNWNQIRTFSRIKDVMCTWAVFQGEVLFELLDNSPVGMKGWRLGH